MTDLERAVNLLMSEAHKANKHWWKDNSGVDIRDNPLALSNKLMLVVTELARIQQEDKKWQIEKAVLKEVAERFRRNGKNAPLVTAEQIALMLRAIADERGKWKRDDGTAQRPKPWLFKEWVCDDAHSLEEIKSKGE